ncbi:hypothetical protein E4U13_000840 [Claviceps humidiphila]|uniref:Uncharacterized protein n=1 Tax=Claviceps humidiphila TaxID=1294629 RepID=A0A9P7Q2A1_9HYPO|nr:hypothetical protein E4U13_000840 [Claviceps humidiphila]
MDACRAKRAQYAWLDDCNEDWTSSSSSVLCMPTVERPKRPIADVQSPQAERTPSRHSAGPPHAESIAIWPRPRTPPRPAIKSDFLTRDDGALPTLGQSSGPGLDDVFAPTSAQPRESIAPSARSSQYHSTTVSDESEAEIDIFTPPVESSNVLQTTRAPVNHPPDLPHPGLPLDPVQVAGELDVPCLTDADQTLLRNFEQALAKNKLTECPHCLIRWFTIGLDQQTGVCKKCTDDNAFREKNPQLPALWSEENELDPGESPAVSWALCPPPHMA